MTRRRYLWRQSESGSFHLLVGDRIQRRRKALGMSERELAKRCGVSYQQMQKYESAENRVSAGRLYVVAEALGVPITYFFEMKPSQRTADDVFATFLQTFASLDPQLRSALAAVVRVIAQTHTRTQSSAKSARPPAARMRQVKSVGRTSSVIGSQNC